MEIQNLAFLPILYVFWTLLGLCALTALTIILGHNKLPFISDTGIEKPESILYTMVFMVMPVLGAMVAWIQYRFMILRCSPSEKRHVIFQRILYAVSWIGCFGTVVNAVLSVRTNPLGHRIGAGIGFATAGIYNICQAIYCYKTSFSSRCICHFRLAAASITAVVLLLFTVGMVSIYLDLCTGHCQQIYIPVLCIEYIGFGSLILQQLTHYTDFQQLNLTLSREGITICLREKTPDPESPE